MKVNYMNQNLNSTYVNKNSRIVINKFNHSLMILNKNRLKLIRFRENSNKLKIREMN